MWKGGQLFFCPLLYKDDIRACHELIKVLPAHNGFRHTYATLNLDAGVDLDVIRELLGHADVQATDNYINVNLKPMRKANEKFSAEFDKMTWGE